MWLKKFCQIESCQDFVEMSNLWLVLLHNFWTRRLFDSNLFSATEGQVPIAMARSSLASLLLLAAATLMLKQAFVPSPKIAARMEMQQAQAAVVATGLSVASIPQPAFAVRVEEDDEGFDLRIVAVLALPVLAIGWALFNVWRVAFRQVVRIGESAKGNPIWVEHRRVQGHVFCHPINPIALQKNS